MQASLGPETILIRGSRTHGSPCQTLQPGFASPIFFPFKILQERSMGLGSQHLPWRTRCVGWDQASSGISLERHLFQGPSLGARVAAGWGMAVSHRFGEPQDRPEAHPPTESETRPSVELGSWLLKNLLHLPTCTKALVWVFHLVCL